MVYTPPAVPTLDDARQAADILAADGAGQVFLFGSVARRTATDGSDIDMVAVYDDIDYAMRTSLADQLEVMASSATGFPVSVYVTDRPEWRMRTTQVHTSLEARIAERGIVLVEMEAGKVNWNKEMVMPQSDYEQGLYRLGRVNEGLVKLANALEPGKMEHLFAGLDDTEGAELAEIGRMLTLGGAGHTVTEQSVKALVHLTEKRSRDLKGHHIEYLIERLGSEAMKSDVESLLTPPGPEAITPWHWWERYHRPGANPYPTPSIVLPVIQAACRIAAYTVTRFGSDSPARSVKATIAVIEEYISTKDLISGKPVPT